MIYVFVSILLFSLKRFILLLIGLLLFELTLGKGTLKKQLVINSSLKHSLGKARTSLS